jgi:hypothetical protein
MSFATLFDVISSRCDPMRHTRTVRRYENRAWRGFALAASLAALAGGILSACFAFSPTEPFPPNAVPLATPIQYGLWWQMVESCSGLSGDLATVRWYVQPGVETLQVSGIFDAAGVWFSYGNRILLTESSVADGPTVRHEMLHALLGSGEKDPHPKLYFRQRCGGIVGCDGPCAIDGGADPLPPSGAAVIDVRDLLVSAQIVPAVDSGGQTGGWIALVISARNPRADPVWVRLAWDPGPNPYTSTTYGWIEFSGPGGYFQDANSVAWVFGDSVAFQGGQTQRFAIDISSVPSGTFLARPFFNTDTLATMQYVVRP